MIPATTPLSASQDLSSGILCRSLMLNNFRNYSCTRIEPDNPTIILIGENGAGKTNILEAISMLAPGRGIRSSKLSEMDRFDGALAHPWSIHAHIDNSEESFTIGTGRDPSGESEKRIVKIDGTASAVADLARAFSCLWITPKLSQIFLEGMTERRKLIDRLVYNFDTEHASRINAYENTMRERNRILRENKANTKWLSAVEKQMAEQAVAIAAARIDMVANLNQVMSQTNSAFPRCFIELEGSVEDDLKTSSALTAESNFIATLEHDRRNDAETGRTGSGTHRTEILVFHGGTGRPVEICSTGEQKAVVISIIMATARARQLFTGRSPVMLLDDIAAHMDHNKRVSLFDELASLRAQTWISGTDINIFTETSIDASIYNIHNGAIIRA